MEEKKIKEGRLTAFIRKIWKRLTIREPRRQAVLRMRVTDRDIEAARRVNLIVLIESLGYKPTQSRGEKAMFFSPLRKETKPSFSVSYYNGRWTWKDWGTGEHGDTISFIQQYHGLDFLDAVRKLNNSVSSSPPPPQHQKLTAYDTDKVSWVRNLHKERTSIMTTGDRASIKRYFLERGVRHYDEMSCIVYDNFKEKKRFVGIPMPCPLDMKGLECREICGSSRQTLGHKCLWMLRRQSPRIVVTESILDALAAEIVLDDYSLTLCSINGVGGVEKLGSLLEALKPQETLFALDNDEPGRFAQQTAMEIAARYCDKVSALDHCIKAGVKDMHKLLNSRSQIFRVAREQ
ncbi:MAG: CHC2 zinc finger domain-containing protein [Syntrophus sp. (in: bacteria)]